jgi:hypothetical protein
MAAKELLIKYGAELPSSEAATNFSKSKNN